VEKFGQYRVTLLPGVLEKARTTLCLVTGADKAEALQAVLEDAGPVSEAPAKISSAEMVWFLDAAAGRLLTAR
jgi:6-phosphogluconolactonase